ncbi:MAG: hypothetical protein ACFBRM_02930 [Pikeienuella sp.]
MSDRREEERMFRAIASALTAVGSVQAACRAARDYERLSSLSDAELVARGLDRERLAEVVLRRHL